MSLLLIYVLHHASVKDGIPFSLQSCGAILPAIGVSRMTAHMVGPDRLRLRTPDSRFTVALARFRRTLKWARPAVRELTHTLHLPPAQAGLYGRPHPEWLGDILKALPNLQSLVVSGLPFFDHQALLALRSRTKDSNPPTYALRLLIAAHCRNTTASSLVNALTHFSNLAYIDLSGNSSARDRSVLSTFRAMPTLHILRLQDCQLRDSDMAVLGTSIGLRVRSLDLRGNYLSDVGVGTLLELCFRVRESRSRATSGVVIENWADWHSGVARPDAKILDEFRDEALNELFVKRLMSGIVKRLPSQDLRESGVTHLYLANNRLSVEGVSTVVKSARLYVLDVGSLDASRLLNKSSTIPSSSPSSSRGYRAFQPGAEKLTPVLGDFAQDLTYLRLHHAVVTHAAPIQTEYSAHNTSELLEGRNSVSGSESAAIAAKLPIDEPAPRYELPKYATQSVLSPVARTRPCSEVEEELPTVERGKSFAPDEAVATDDASGTEAGSVLTASGLGLLSHAENGVHASQQQATESAERIGATALDTEAESILTEIQKQRQQLDSSLRKAPHGLLPSTLPRLRTLVLTGVPCYDTTGILDLLIGFIRACASETEIARLRSRLGSKTWQISESSQTKSSAHLASSTFPLRRIVLEMGPPGSSSASHKPSSSGMPVTPDSAFRTKSSTEDPDGEVFWSAGEKDFSFFDNDDDDEGNDRAEGSSWPIPQPAPDAEVGKDVVQELAKFRRDRKAAYEAALQSGQPYVEGYWPGEIKVIRWQARATDQADYYGKAYERGIYR